MGPGASALSQDDSIPVTGQVLKWPEQIKSGSAASAQYSATMCQTVPVQTMEKERETANHAERI